ncbi:MAG: nitronate monooxygenase, partial [Acidimicrobiales bacterium]
MERPVLRTRICDILGIEYPVLLAGMGPTIGDGPQGVAGPELVAAVSNAGGLGVLGGTGLGPEAMEDQILRIRSLTDRPFGVDILLPVIASEVPDRSELPEDLRTLLPPEHRAGVEEIR